MRWNDTGYYLRDFEATGRPTVGAGELNGWPSKTLPVVVLKQLGTVQWFGSDVETPPV